MCKLFEPLTIRDITFRNRIFVSPMCQYSSKDGFANDWHLVHLGSRAVGGAGLVIAEATAVSPEGRITPADLGIWKDEHIEYLKRIATFIHLQGSVAGIQLAHAGRKASRFEPWKNNEPATEELGGWQIVGPSPVAFNGYETPAELTKEGVQRVIEIFVSATQRALAAGFRVIEIHGAHGYLIHSFFSPYSNKRTDEYGGSFENRTRFLIEITEAVRNVWPREYPLFVRISATDWIEDGWTKEDSVELAKVLEQKGVDLIDCSTGGNVPNVKIPLRPGYQVEFAEAVRNRAGILSGAVGLITSAQQAEEILAKSQADVIIMAREFLRDPYFPIHAARQLGVDHQWPVQYLRAKNKNPG